ncbi:hypothetical protein ACWD48_12125 [Streptomyces sp. NPDC002519]
MVESTGVHLPLSADSIRRWFFVATCGSVAGSVLLAVTVTPVVMWLGDFRWADVRGSDWPVAVPPAAAVGWLVWEAVKEIRWQRRALSAKARELAASARSEDGTELRMHAEQFILTLLNASTFFNTRILPRRAARGFARRVRDEAETGEIDAATLRVIDGLASADSMY